MGTITDSDLRKVIEKCKEETREFRDIINSQEFKNLDLTERKKYLRFHQRIGEAIKDDEIPQIRKQLNQIYEKQYGTQNN